MRYRDDREAQRERANALQADLEHAEARLREAEANVARHEDKDVREHQQIKFLREEVSRLRGVSVDSTWSPPKKQQGRSVGFYFGILIAAIVTVVGVVTFVNVRKNAKRSAPASTAGTNVKPMVRGYKKKPPPKPETRFVAAGGLLMNSKKAGLPDGTGCFMLASLGSTTKLGQQPRATYGWLQCANRVFYNTDSKATKGADHNHHGTATEHAFPDKSLAYWIKYTHEDATSRFDTAVNGRYARFGSATFGATGRVYLSEYTFPRRGPHRAKVFYTKKFLPLQVSAVVTTATGKGPKALSKKGERCSLMVLPHTEMPFNCRATLVCGGAVVVGNLNDAGRKICEFDAKTFGVKAFDDQRTTAQDGDPALKLDVSQKSLSIEDETNGSRWSTTFVLSTPSECGWSSEWNGHLLGIDGKSSRARVVSGAGTLTPQIHLHGPKGEPGQTSTEPTAKIVIETPGCETRFELKVNDPEAPGTFKMEYGLDWRTVAGYDEHGRLLVLAR